MSNFITRKIEEYRCKKSLRNYFEPGEDFLCEIKKLFLDKIAPEESTKKARHSWFNLPEVLKYSLASFFGLIFLGSGAAVYADKTNVDYSHPLYNFKRVAEAMRVNLAPEEQLPILHNELAQRRLDEVKKIEAADILVTTTTETVINADIKKHQEIITKLRNDMRQEVNTVISEIEEKHVQEISAHKLCDSVSDIIKEDEKRGDGEVKEIHMKNWARLEKNCGDFINASSTNPLKED